MGVHSRLVLAVLLGLTAALIAACGSSQKGYLSSDQSATIATRLNAIDAAVSAGSCGRARAAAASLSSYVDSLPPSVSRTLSRNLGQGASTVSSLSAHDCAASTTTSTTPTTTETTTTTTTVTPTTSSTTTTSTSSTTPTQTTSSTSSSTPAPPTSTSTTTGGGGFQGGKGKGIHPIGGQ